MTAEVVHEVKNPLGGIRGFAELLERDLEDGDVRKKSVRKIIQGVETLNRMVTTLLDYAKPVALSPRKTEMISFVDEAVSFFEMDSSQNKTNLRLVKSYPQEKIYCELDAQQFRQTVLNLLHNATQAMPDGGEIKVELRRGAESSASSREKHAARAVLKVSDTGVGMNEETQKKIFTPFFTTKEGGTGLGLSTVKKIVEAHRGVIRLKSKPGEGTTVAMELPMIS
jgi:signal transduction histidine kinase